MATNIFDDIKWADPVSFMLGGRKYIGIVTVVDKFGGGQYWGVCTSFDILVDREIYQHIPYSDVCKIEENQLSDNLVMELKEMLKRRDGYIHKQMS